MSESLFLINNQLKQYISGKSYDHHFVVKELTSLFGDKMDKVEVIAQNSEKFMEIKTPYFVFRDSFLHLSSSLDTLTKNLKNKGPECFPLIRKQWPDDNKFNAALSKAVYCYDFVTSVAMFNEPIPPIEAFKNSMTGEDLPLSEYDRLLLICSLFNITTIGQLHDFYLMVGFDICIQLFT